MPRGFWDYALFALIMTGAILFLFWLEASDGVGRADGFHVVDLPSGSPPVTSERVKQLEAGLE